jgi:hypothetical protein
MNQLFFELNLGSCTYQTIVPMGVQDHRKSKMFSFSWIPNMQRISCLGTSDSRWRRRFSFLKTFSKTRNQSAGSTGKHHEEVWKPVDFDLNTLYNFHQ